MRWFYAEFSAGLPADATGAGDRGRRRNGTPCSFDRNARCPCPKARRKRKPKGRKAAETARRIHLFDGLEQRHLDLIGLFLVASGIYLIFVLFFGWEGGKVGYGIETGLIYLFGTVGARIFTLLMLVARRDAAHRHLGLGPGARDRPRRSRVFLGGFKAARRPRTARQSSDEWRQPRDEPTASDQGRPRPT